MHLYRTLQELSFYINFHQTSSKLCLLSEFMASLTTCPAAGNSFHGFITHGPAAGNAFHGFITHGPAAGNAFHGFITHGPAAGNAFPV